jgi:hypothetical protein
MLMIRREQMQALDRDFDDRLIEEMSSWLKARFPESAGHVHAKRALRGDVCEALRRSRCCGLLTASDHRSYLLVSAVLGWDFHTQPQYLWIEQCLANTSLGAPEGRMADVLQSLRRQLESQDVSV